MFSLDPTLAGTSAFAVDLTLCQVRVHDDLRWPWLVLVPRRSGASELEHLTASERVLLMDDVIASGEAVRALGAAADRPVEKLNIAALGNVVSQLHVHVVGRRGDDVAWPAPVWGVGAAAVYGAERLEHAATLVRRVLRVD